METRIQLSTDGVEVKTATAFTDSGNIGMEELAGIPLDTAIRRLESSGWKELVRDNGFDGRFWITFGKLGRVK